MQQQNMQAIMDKVRQDHEAKAKERKGKKVTLRALIEQSLAQKIVSSQPAPRVRDRGKGRSGGMQRSLLNLHRDMKHDVVLDTTSDRWIDGADNG